MTKPLVSIIVVNYKTKDMTIECIESVLTCFESDVDYELILVENYSNDGSAEAFFEKFPKDQFPRLEIIATQENLGFAGANNMAATKATGEYILFLNPDTLVPKGAIEKLLAFAEKKPDGGAWGGRTIFGDGALNPTSLRAFTTLRGLFFWMVGLSAAFKKSAFFNPDDMPDWRRDSERAVDILFFCFVLMKRDLWEELGGFDLRFFMFSEDDDVCWRLEKRGLKRWFTPEATIVHYGGASTPNRASRMVNLLRSKLLWLDLHWSGAQRSAARGIIWWGVFMRRVAEGLMAAARPRPPMWRDVWRERGDWLAPAPDGAE